MKKKKKKNEGIIMTGGKIEANNLAVGKHAKIENVNSEEAKTNQSEEEKTNTINTELKKKISNNKTKQVISELLKLLENSEDPESLNAVYLLSGKFQDFKSKKRIGTITTEEYDLYQSKINNALLEIIDINF